MPQHVYLCYKVRTDVRLFSQNEQIRQFESPRSSVKGSSLTNIATLLASKPTMLKIPMLIKGYRKWMNGTIPEWTICGKKDLLKGRSTKETIIKMDKWLMEQLKERND